MRKIILLVAVIFCVAAQSNAQFGVVKMVGKNANNYSLGYGAYLKGAYPLPKGASATLELGFNDFALQDGGEGDGTVVVPLKIGYRYTINHSGTGFYVEPQVGYNLVGVTSINVNGYTENYKFHGVVFAANAGYIIPIKSCPIDLNLKYETVSHDGGSENYVSLGLSLYLRFKRRDY
ncbi:hypothetical protein [Parasediminibacterium sp. JCM 36343]|uniref:hypothetical protein n=1 Tax=Parasediminibacterium sp. JCM 36343 TaxID=3374279 RepID=UPI00397BB077